MIKIGKHGILKRDIISVYFDNEDYEITVYLNKEKHSNSDEIYIYCDNRFQYYWNVLKIGDCCCVLTNDNNLKEVLKNQTILIIEGDLL